LDTVRGRDDSSAERAVVVGTGPKARLEFAADHPTRLRAVAEALDRAYGKPTQPVEEEDRQIPRRERIDEAVAELVEEMERRDRDQRGR
jgi:hypothetical protein